MLFGALRDRAGSDVLELHLREGATVAEALDRLRNNHALSPLLQRVPVAMAVNRDYAAAGTTLAQGDELALIPPLSGGA